MSEHKIFPCPQCKKPVDWKQSAWKPFCSERCKLIDLGEWFNEEHRIAEDKDSSV